MQTDILIVGGGLSGLALADHLTQSGRDILLVEAQDRLGGRILTETLSGGRFDLGPAWFWPDQPRMERLVRRFDLPVFEQFSTGDLTYQDQSGAVQRGRGYASMQGSYRIDGGMVRLIENLANTLDAGRVKTQTRLLALTRGADQITALLASGETETDTSITAKQVVLALPPRVMAHSLRFDPALDPSQTETLQQIPTWMAGHAKTIATYDTPHWRNAGLSGDGMSHRGPLVEIHDASPRDGGPYALFGFVGVPANLRSVHQDQMMGLVTQQLVALFGDAMASPRDLVLKDWATVPEVATPLDQAVSGAHPSYRLPASLRHLWDETLHLGSTETAADFGGFLEGALEAAETLATRLKA